MKTLGPYWTTRIVSVPDAPLVRPGPYRYVRHPNYFVAGEIAVLPLVFGECAWRSFLRPQCGHAAWRIRQEAQRWPPAACLTAR